MASTSARMVESNLQRPSLAPTGSYERLRDLLLQLSLIWTVIAIIWHLFATEPQSSFGNGVQLIAIGVGFCLSIVLWIAGCPWRSASKGIVTCFCFATALLTGIYSAREFDAGSHILERAKVNNGRIVHESIGLSYAIPAGCRINLQPLITQSLSSNQNHSAKLPTRLQFGEMAILSRIVKPVSSQNSSRSTTSIILEVQRGTIADLNGLTFEVRRNESKWATFPNMTITRSTHVSRIAGLDMVEFEFIEEPRHLMSRQIYLRVGQFIFNFMLNTEHEDDRPIFNEFLQSIHLDSIPFAAMLKRADVSSY